MDGVRRNRVIALLLTLWGVNAYAQSQAELILAPVQLASPRQTMQSFMGAMAKYKKAVDANQENAKAHLDHAVKTLDLSGIPNIIRRDKGREAAIYLKEVMDRVAVVPANGVPGLAEVRNGNTSRWRFPSTEIELVARAEEPQMGSFLFSSDTVMRAEVFFEKVQHLPYVEGSGLGASYEEPWVQRQLPAWALEQTLGMLRWQWVGIFLAILLGLWIRHLAHFSIAILRKIAARSRVEWDDDLVSVSERPAGLILASAFWFFGLQALRLEGFALATLAAANQIVFSIALVWLIYRYVDVAEKHFGRLASTTDSNLDDQLVPLLAKASRVFVVIFGALISIQNLGVNVMSLLAGLGLGGLAFALAAKDTAANLFGSIMILWDRPFRVGDWIKVGSNEGNVEEIGFRSTRVRTFYNSQISIPNSVIANANIDNMGRREYRRIVMNLGVTYDTSPEKIELFLEGIKNIIKASPVTRKDYFHVVFTGYGASSLDILLYYFVQVVDWSRELVAKQNVNLEILRLAQDLGVSFAYPSQSLYVETMPGVDSGEGAIKADITEAEAIAQAYGPGGNHAKPAGLGHFRPPYLD